MDNEPKQQPSTSQPPEQPAYQPDSATNTQQASTAASPFDQPQSESSTTHANVTEPQPFGPPKKSHKKLIAIVVAGLLLLFAGAAAAAYTFWYQDPQKVVTDAVVNALRADSMSFDSSVVATGKGASAGFEELNLTMDGQTSATKSLVNVSVTIKADGETTEFSGSGLWGDDSNFYLKFTNANQLLRQYIGSTGEVPPSLQAIVDKINDKWIRISTSDTGEISEEYKKQQECIADVTKRIESDPALFGEISSLYRSNQFIVIAEELGVRDGNLGYVIEPDNEKLKSFVAGLNDTAVVKQLNECYDGELKFDPEDFTAQETESAQQRLEIWISQFSHELRELKLTLSDDIADGTISFKPVFNEPVTVETPTEYITLKELYADLIQLWFSAASESIEQFDATSGLLEGSTS